MVDQLESNFRGAISDEERQKTQQLGETMFYVFVGAILPNINSFSPCARVAIVLVEQLAQFFMLNRPNFREHASVAHHSPQSWRRTFRANFEQRSSSVTLIM